MNKRPPSLALAVVLIAVIGAAMLLVMIIDWRFSP